METVEITLFVIASTSNAVLVSEEENDADSTSKAIWLPYSQLNGASEFNVTIGEFQEFEINEWLATEKGLT